MSKKPEFNEAVDIYYKLKNEYSEKVHEHKHSIRNDSNLTLKEKRAKFANTKPKCINCSKFVGTIFETRYSPETNQRHLIAKCGDTRNPCELSINIAIGQCDLFTSHIKQIEDVLEENKQHVIRDKNNMLFGYITSDEALKLFDKYKKEITEYTAILESTLTEYSDATLNKSKLAEIKKIQQDIYVNINEIKKQMDNYADTNNTQSIKNAVTIYIDNLLPLNKSLIDTKYKACVVEYNDITKEYHLIQKENTIDSLELCFESNVISFQMSYSNNEPGAKQSNRTETKKSENEEKRKAKEEKEREKEEKRKAKEEKEREKKEKEDNEKAKEDKECENECDTEEKKTEDKKKAKEDKKKEDKKKAKEEKEEQKKEEKRKAKEEKEKKKKEEKEKAKEEKKKNKQKGGYYSSSDDESDSSSSSSSSSDESESSSDEDESKKKKNNYPH